jgi:cell division protein FtsB
MLLLQVDFSAPLAEILLYPLEHLVVRRYNTHNILCIGGFSMRKSLRNKIFLFVSVGIALVVGLYVVFSSSGLLHVHHLKQQKSDLDRQVKKLQDENDLLQQQIFRLENDKEYLEKTMRDKLQLIMPDESIVMFEEAPTDGAGKP